MLLVALVAALLHSPPGQAQTQTFSEDFHTSTYMDAAHTTAHWDTSSGLLKLPPTEPIASHYLGRGGYSPAVYVPETGRAYCLSSAIYEYDPQRNITTPLDYSGPRPHDYFVAAAYASAAGRIYLFGGWDRCPFFEPCPPQKNIYEFDPVARTTTILATELPYGLDSATAAYVPSTNKVYIFGGRTPDRLSAEILEFDVATHSLQVLSVSLPTARWAASAAYVPDTNRIYIFGGYNVDDVTLDEILAFDPSTKQLSLLQARLPVGLHKSAVAYVPRAERVFLFGGERPGGLPSKLVLTFDAVAETIEETPYTLPGDGAWDAAAIYAPESDWLALLGGDTFGGWPKQYAGILRLRWNGSSFTEWDTFLPEPTDTIGAVYVPEENKAYLFGSGRAEIRQFDINTSIVYTMSATLPVTSTDPGVVWVPAEHLAYIFDRSGIYTYDPNSDTLTTMTAQLPTSFDPRVVAYAPPRNAIYLFDSADGSGAILRYNLDDGTLITLGAHLLPPRRGAYAVYVPNWNLIFIMGGWGYQISSYLDDIWVFDVARETLTRQQRLLMPLPGVYKASVRMPTANNIYLFGGWGGWSETYAFGFPNIWHFDTTPIRHLVTHALPAPLGGATIVWASAEDRLYAFGGRYKRGVTRLSADSIQRFDWGHSEHGIALSTCINSNGADILRATLTVDQKLNGGTVDYFLSNNGGGSWEPVTPGVEHTFAAPGSDLRWQAVLNGDGIETPMVGQLTIYWSGEEPTATPTATYAPTHTPTATKPVHTVYLPIIQRLVPR